MHVTKPQVLRGLSIVLIITSGPIFMMSTNPENLRLVFIMVPFLWLFAAIFAVAWLVAGRSAFLAVRQRRAMTAGSVAALPTLLLVLASIHQLMWRDVLLVVGIVGLSVFYMSRADFIK